MSDLETADRMVAVLEDSAGVATSLLIDALASLEWVDSPQAVLKDARESILAAIEELGLPKWAAQELAMNRKAEK